MTNLYAVLHRLSGSIFPDTPLNPRLAYGVVKGVWRRVKRDVLGIEYRPDINSVNIVIHDVRLLLCSLPRVAGTTFRHELVNERKLGERVSWYSNYLGDLLLRRPELQGYYKVTFVRNPWARVLSVYNSHVCSPTPFHVRGLFIRYPGLRHGMPFDQFVDWLCNSRDGRDAVADQHWLSQHRFICSGETLLVDRIARLESLQEDLMSICDVLGVSAPVIANHSLKTTAGGRSYRRFFTAETAELVARRYSRDIELFGYDF